MPTDTAYDGPTWVTIDEGDRLGIVFSTDDGGTELVYLMRDLHDRVLQILHGGGDVLEDFADLRLSSDFASLDIGFSSSFGGESLVREVDLNDRAAEVDGGDQGVGGGEAVRAV